MKNRILKLPAVYILLFTICMACNESCDEMSEDLDKIIFKDDFEQGNLDAWQIGGRQLGRNSAEVISRNGSNQAHISHESFTEITLERVFGYSQNLLFEFDMETAVHSEASSTSDFYSLAGVSFHFLNNTQTEELGWVEYTRATSSFPKTTYKNDETKIVNEISSEGPVNYQISMNQLLEQVQLEYPVDSIRLKFRVYGSGWPFNLNADLWVDNVVVTEK
ncbi:hypothetical protein QQ008_24245 [Fulvivirgaceae bacterium BMA10]|uniref:Uncharacterized protein n=1 Tax=Splendidivirga corallicola TaxID=3051826 RepID=A0ABT8KYN7_9BACT|nr:hypothetical protein [Fulvivirgaceae bacterium BMA10]